MATLENVNFGAAPNDGSGDELRTGIEKLVANDKAINDDLIELALNAATTDEVVQMLSDRVAVLYPNGGSEASPANVTNNGRYVMPNPFPGHEVICTVKLYVNGGWGETGGFTNGIQSGQTVVFGCIAGMFGDNIVLQTGFNYLLAGSPYQGNMFGNTAFVTTAPAKIIVMRKD